MISRRKLYLKREDERLLKLSVMTERTSTGILVPRSININVPSAYFKRLRLFHIPYRILLAYHCPLGNNVRSWTSYQMISHILVIRNDINILYLTYTLLYLRKALNTAFRLMASRGTCLIYADENKALKIIKSPVFTFVSSWLPGLITNHKQMLHSLHTNRWVSENLGNFFLKRPQMTALSVSSIQPYLMGKRILFNPNAKKRAFARVPRKKFPRVSRVPAFSLSALDNYIWLNECNHTGIPTVLISDTQSFINQITFPIISNQRSVPFTYLVINLLSEVANHGVMFGHFLFSKRKVTDYGLFFDGNRRGKAFTAPLNAEANINFMFARNYYPFAIRKYYQSSGKKIGEPNRAFKAKELSTTIPSYVFDGYAHKIRIRNFTSNLLVKKKKKFVIESINEIDRIFGDTVEDIFYYMRSGFRGMKYRWFLCNPIIDSLHRIKLWKDLIPNFASHDYIKVRNQKFDKEENINKFFHIFRRDQKHYLLKIQKKDKNKSKEAVSKFFRNKIKRININKPKKRQKLISRKKPKKVIRQLKIDSLAAIFNEPKVSLTKNLPLIKKSTQKDYMKHMRRIFIRYRKNHPSIKFSSLYLTLFNKYKKRVKLKYKLSSHIKRSKRTHKEILKHKLKIIKPVIQRFVEKGLIRKKTTKVKATKKLIKKKTVRPIVRRRRRIPMNSWQRKELLKMKRFNRKYRSWRPGKFGKFFHKYLLPVTAYNLEIRNIIVAYKEKHDIFHGNKLALKERLKEERERLKEERRKNSFYGNYYKKRNNMNYYEKNYEKKNRYKRKY